MAPKLAPKKEEVGAGRASRKASAPRVMVKEEEVGNCQASKRAPALRPRVKKDVNEEGGASACRASEKAPASRLTVKTDVEGVDVGGTSRKSVKQEVVQDEDLVDEPVKRRRIKKDAATKVPSEVLDLESDTVQRSKNQRSRAKDAKRKEVPSAALTEEGLPSLAGLLPSSASCHDADLPLEIPKEYFEGRLHLPESIVAVKVEKPAEETILVVDMAAIPWSDSGAVCRQVLDALIKEPRSDLHSMCPVMKSYLIHVLKSMESKEQEKKGNSQTKVGKNDDMIASLMGLDHDAAALLRMRHGWSSPWDRGRHHIAVNMMDQALELQDKKTPRGHRAPAMAS